MYTIQTNQSGTRSLDINDIDLETIKKYELFNHLIPSNGIIDEGVLDKLKMNIRSLISADMGDCSDLLNLCIDVVYHDNMKAFGLQRLISLYEDWNAKQTDINTHAEGSDEQSV